MPKPSSFDYATIRVVPRVEREEFVNAGVILFCRARRFLDARIALNQDRLRALAPNLDLDEVGRHLAQTLHVAQGDPAGGPIAALPPAERFRWLVAPRSTILQTSSVHSGLCADPAAALEHLFDTLVRLPAGDR